MDQPKKTNGDEPIFYKALAQYSSRGIQTYWIGPPMWTDSDQMYHGRKYGQIDKNLAAPSTSLDFPRCYDGYTTVARSNYSNGRKVLCLYMLLGHPTF